MSPIPTAFAQAHRIAGFTNSQIESRWANLFEYTAKDILSWLSTNPLLTDIQKNRLNERLEKINAESKQTTFFVELDPVLEENQKTVVAKKYAEIFRQKLSQTMEEVTGKCTPEQKQVLEALVKSQQK